MTRDGFMSLRLGIASFCKDNFYCCQSMEKDPNFKDNLGLAACHVLFRDSAGSLGH